jgi:hypothetical protein
MTQRPIHVLVDVTQVRDSLIQVFSTEYVAQTPHKHGQADPGSGKMYAVALHPSCIQAVNHHSVSTATCKQEMRLVSHIMEPILCFYCLPTTAAKFPLSDSVRSEDNMILIKEIKGCRHRRMHSPYQTSDWSQGDLPQENQIQISYQIFSSQILNNIQLCACFPQQKWNSYQAIHTSVTIIHIINRCPQL